LVRLRWATILGPAAPLGSTGGSAGEAEPCFLITRSLHQNSSGVQRENSELASIKWTAKKEEVQYANRMGKAQFSVFLERPRGVEVLAGGDYPFLIQGINGYFGFLFIFIARLNEQPFNMLFGIARRCNLTNE
jgi:hypothetical protein